ncbi:MAG: tRNA (adenosine(37)-N6)-dimethylallyltransferase MiaA [Syntrophobacterales bacterium]|nr:tRNA (adenosine(37)-N6)-dimethylallyltransferase MiaA [Syntrophobacterales bacterium]
MGKDYNLIVILGATATGKTQLAARLAGELNSEVISADSRQIYRGMDLGTGKDLAEFVVDGRRVPYHLIDIVDPDDEFNVFEYQKRFFECFSEITQRGIVPVMVGGTGLYIETVIKGYMMLEVPENPGLREELSCLDMEALAVRLLAVNPAPHNTTDLLDRSRLIRAIEIAKYTNDHQSSDKAGLPDIRPFIIGIRFEREILRRRITARLKKRIEMGMIDEVKRLHEAGTSWEKLSFFGLEYRYISLYLQGRMTCEDMFKTLNTRIHQFAKRQETWFRRMEKRGTIIHWIDGADYDAVKKLVRNM